MTKMIVNPQMAEKMKNVPAKLHCARKLNEYVIIQEPNQLTTATRLPATPFTFIGNISDIITQGMPPMPKENDPVKIKTPPRDRKGLDSRSLRSCNKNDNPIKKQPNHVPAAETKSSGRLPDLSINRTPKTVIGT